MEFQEYLHLTFFKTRQLNDLSPELPITPEEGTVVNIKLRKVQLNVYINCMQPIKQLTNVLASLADQDHYLFSLRDLETVIPGQSPAACKAMVARAEKNGLLKRVCRSLYLYPGANYPPGLVLYHTAARLRAHEFNYISLETALSDSGVISQIPTHWITLMSSGRSYTIDCGGFGHIEFIHTKKKPVQLAARLEYDARCHLWRAAVELAFRDMKAARRPYDLIDLEVAHEFI